MALITTQSIQRLLVPGLMDVFANYETYANEYKKMFSIRNSNKAVEMEVEMQTLPAAQLKTQGSSTVLGTMQQMYTSSFTNVTYSNGFLITQEALRDNLYKEQFPNAATSMRTSLAYAKEITGASVYNNAFNASYVGGDGQPLCSTSHPLAQGSSSNTFAIPTQLSESAIQDAWITIQSVRNAAGLLTPLHMKLLIVPTALQWTANMLIGSKYRPDTATNAINPIYHIDGGLFEDGYMVSHYLTNPFSWFIRTNCAEQGAGGLRHYRRQKVSFDMSTDPLTKNLIVTGTERYCFGWSNWRDVFGSSGI